METAGARFIWSPAQTLLLVKSVFRSDHIAQYVRPSPSTARWLTTLRVSGKTKENLL